MTLEAFLAETRSWVDDALGRWLPPEESEPSRLNEAMQIAAKHERSAAVKVIESEVKTELVDAYRNEKVEIGSLADWEDRRDGLAALSKDAGRILHDIGGGILRERVLAEGIHEADQSLPRLAARAVPGVYREHDVGLEHLVARGDFAALCFVLVVGVAGFDAGPGLDARRDPGLGDRGDRIGHGRDTSLTR